MVPGPVGSLVVSRNRWHGNRLGGAQKKAAAAKTGQLSQRM